MGPLSLSPEPLELSFAIPLHRGTENIGMVLGAFARGPPTQQALPQTGQSSRPPLESILRRGFAPQGRRGMASGGSELGRGESIRPDRADHFLRGLSVECRSIIRRVCQRHRPDRTNILGT